MNAQVLTLLMLVFIMFSDAKQTKNDNDDDDDLDLALLKESMLRRYLLERESLFEDRDVSIFTEEQQKFQNDALNTHNTLRALHCAPPLVLDDEINIRCQNYAEYLASNDSRLIHSTNRGGRFGENLYAVTRTNPITNPDADKVTRTWYSEVSRYNYSTPGYTPNIAHFSQIVWKNSKRLGVGYAFAREGRKMYVVAQYSPPGNYGFAYSTNVLEPTCQESR